MGSSTSQYCYSHGLGLPYFHGLVIGPAKGYAFFMSDAELIKTLDYILNRCDKGSIEAVAAAVVRRRRDLAYMGSMDLPDPKRLAEIISSNMNIGANLDGLRNSVRDMAVNIIKQEAPELTDEQVEVLTREWIPSGQDSDRGGKSLPGSLLSSMISQFIDYSTGNMGALEERELRKDIGDWPKRYWKAFPEVIRLLIKDFLKGEISEEEFNMKLETALAMK